MNLDKMSKTELKARWYDLQITKENIIKQQTEILRRINTPEPKQEDKEAPSEDGNK